MTTTKSIIIINTVIWEQHDHTLTDLIVITIIIMINMIINTTTITMVTTLISLRATQCSSWHCTLTPLIIINIIIIIMIIVMIIIIIIGQVGVAESNVMLSLASHFDSLEAERCMAKMEMRRVKVIIIVIIIITIIMTSHHHHHHLLLHCHHHYRNHHLDNFYCI